MEPTELELGSEVTAKSCGMSVSPEERAALGCSLPLLRARAKLVRVLFWGKIAGINATYLLAKGFTKDSLLSRPTFFWSHDGIDWLQLVPVDDETAKLCRGIRGRFIGDPAFAHTVEVPVVAAIEHQQQQPQEQQKPDMPPVASIASTSEEVKPPAITVTAPRVEVVPPPRESDAEGESDAGGTSEDEDGGDGNTSGQGPRTRNITLIEEKRLAVIVSDIDEATAVVPRGALLLTAQHDVIANPAFSGLVSTAEALRTDAWLHVRNPMVAAKRALLVQAGLARTLDFLDTLAEDVPQEQWAITASGIAVTVRSLLWPGAVAYHVPDTRRFGHCYMGFGEKCFDLAFLL